MTGGGPGVSLSPVSGGGTVQPWRRHPSTALHVAYPPRQTQPSWNVRGEQVMFTITSPKHGTANHLNPPTPPPLPRTKHSRNGRRGGTGGNHQVAAQARHCKSPTPPPPPPKNQKKGKRGGGDRGCSWGRHSCRH